jgi:centromeric protein E
VRQILQEECNDSSGIDQGDAFRTPCFKAAPKAFVAKRSNYSMLPDYSPLPDTFSNVADEDTWLKMNKGYIADLDLLQMTPARRVQSFPSSDVTPVSLYCFDFFFPEHNEFMLFLIMIFIFCFI